MPETYLFPAVGLNFLAGVVGVFLAREIGMPYYVIIALAIFLTAFGNPFLQLVGGIALATSVARIIDITITEAS